MQHIPPYDFVQLELFYIHRSPKPLNYSSFSAQRSKDQSAYLASYHADSDWIGVLQNRADHGDVDAQNLLNAEYDWLTDPRNRFH